MAYTNETMEQHILVGLKVMDLYIKRHYSIRVLKALKKFAINKKISVDAILRLAYILHDIGKGLKRFQRTLRFGGHEWFSAFIVDNSNIIIDNKPLPLNVKRVISLAILLHHHTMIKDQVKTKIRNISDELEPECINVILKFIPQNIKISNIIPRKINGNYVLNYINNNLIKTILTKYYREVYLLLVPLTVADNYAAIMNRKGKGTILGREITKVVELWRNKIGA